MKTQRNIRNEADKFTAKDSMQQKSGQEPLNDEKMGRIQVY